MKIWLISVLMLFTACLPRPGDTANAVRTAGVVSNAAAATLEAAPVTKTAIYRVEPQEQVNEAVTKDWTRGEATAAVGTIRGAWAPLWKAFAEARACHTKLVEALRAGQSVAELYVLLDQLQAKEREALHLLKKNQGEPR